MSEQRVIDHILAATRDIGPRPRLGPGDDAAISAGGEVVTVDALIEGVHFDAHTAPADLGFKTVAASVSDLAAMGARPSWALLSLSLPSPDDAWVAAFAHGLAAAARRWGVALIGGDTTASPGPVAVSLTAAGRLVGAPMRRDGGRPGDHLWVTGSLGLAHVGWSAHAARHSAPEPAHAAFLRPEPPLAFALALARAGLAHAAMDLSDGLAADLPKLAAASHVGARVDPAGLPLVPGVTTEAHALRGGEDYQLLFTAHPRHAPTLRGLASATNTRLTRIGQLTREPLVLTTGGHWPNASFVHFGPEKSRSGVPDGPETR